MTGCVRTCTIADLMNDVRVNVSLHSQPTSRQRQNTMYEEHKNGALCREMRTRLVYYNMDCGPGDCGLSALLVIRFGCRASTNYNSAS